jgi:hypothetical protein
MSISFHRFPKVDQSMEKPEICGLSPALSGEVQGPHSKKDNLVLAGVLTSERGSGECEASSKDQHQYSLFGMRGWK